MLLHGTVTLLPPVAQPLHCSPSLLVTFAHRLGLSLPYSGLDLVGCQRAASIPGEGKAPEGPGHSCSCEVTGTFPSVGSALSSPSLHAYLAGQVKSPSHEPASPQAHLHFPGHVVLSPGWARSAMLPLEPARPPVTALLSQPGGTAAWSSHHSWHAAFPRTAVPCSCRSLG